MAIGIVNVKTRNVEPVEVLRKRYIAVCEIFDRENVIASLVWIRPRS